MKAASTLKSPLSRLFEASAEAWRRQDYDQSIAALEQAHRLAPGNVRVLLDLGRAHGMRYAYPAAEECFEKAVRLAPNKAETLTAASTHAHDFGNYAMAAHYLEKAIEKPAPPESLVKLADLYERQHRKEEALELVHRALSFRPDCPPALLALSRFEIRAGRHESAQRRLRSLALAPSLDTWTRARAGYELGASLDQTGSYEAAWAAFVEAKALLLPQAKQASVTLEGIQARVLELKQTVTAEVIQLWREAAEDLGQPMRLAVLCGHPRSGTTLLEQVLDSHPEIVSAEETHILHDEAYLPLTRDFAPDTPLVSVLNASASVALREARKRYMRCMELFLGKNLQGNLLVDKNPALNVLIPAILRIFPEAKLLVALRDPRDVCLSCFMQPLPINPVSSAYLTIERTARQYASVAGLWRSLLPQLNGQYMEVRYESLVKDLPAVSREVLSFLKVDWNGRVLRYNEHARSRLIRSPTYDDVTKPVFQRAVGRWRNYEKHLEKALETLQPFIAAFGY